MGRERKGRTVLGGKNGGDEEDIRHVTTFGVAKLQSAPGADNPRYATVKI